MCRIVVVVCCLLVRLSLSALHICLSTCDALFIFMASRSICRILIKYPLFQLRVCTSVWLNIWQHLDETVAVLTICQDKLLSRAATETACTASKKKTKLLLVVFNQGNGVDEETCTYHKAVHNATITQAPMITQ